MNQRHPSGDETQKPSNDQGSEDEKGGEENKG